MSDNIFSGSESSNLQKNKTFTQRRVTIFSLPKAFKGHIGIIQHNAIQSWMRLEPTPDILLLGNDPGVAEYAAKYGLRHCPDIDCSRYGTPLISSIFQKGQALALTPYVAYVNTDIILDGLTRAVLTSDLPEKFLIVGRRTNLMLWKPLDLTDPQWLIKLKRQASKEGFLFTQWGIDYFLFNNGLFNDIPPFAVGKIFWDNWMLAYVKAHSVPLIDATRDIQAIHQDHDYSHLNSGYKESRDGKEAEANRKLLAPYNPLHIGYADHCLENGHISFMYEEYRQPENPENSLPALCYTHTIAQQAAARGQWTICRNQLEIIERYRGNLSTEENSALTTFQEKYFIGELPQNLPEIACPAPLLEESVRFRLSRLELLRTTVERIDPTTTTVVTFSQVLEEAIEHYSHLNPPLIKLPNFLLVDCKEENARRELAEKYDVHILPMANLKDLSPSSCCLYARPSARHWENGCYTPLVKQCAAEGLSSGYLVDAATTAPLWRRTADASFVEKRFGDICTVYAVLADEASKDVFLRAVKTIATGDPGYLPVSPYPQYQHPLVQAQKGEVIIEGGLDSGHTTLRFSRQVGPEGRVYGFEALPSAIPALKEYTRNYENIRIEALGLWSCANTFYIENHGGGSRMIASPTSQSETCHSIDIDSYIGQHGERCDMIKLNIEGAEEECLKGALRTLRHYRPKLQIALYHELSHYLDIPLMLIRENLGYKFYCGHDVPWHYETVLYALPPQQNLRSLFPIFTKANNPAISVIIPVYNDEATLERCLDSVLLQQVPTLEIILVDDGSTDKTLQIISTYTRRYPKIVRSLRIPSNRGAGCARTAGLRMATGNYLTFVDSDDMLAEGCLETSIRIMEKEQADIVAFDMIVVREEPWQETCWGVEPGIWAGEKSLEQLLLKKAGSYATYSKVYRKNFIDHFNIQYGKTHVHEDMFFSVQAFYHSRKTVVVPDIGYYRYIRPGSVSSLFHGKEHLDSFLRFVGFLTRFFESHGLDIESDMYKYVIRVTYGWDRDRICRAISEADQAGELEDWLNENRLRDLETSKEALCLILADYAVLHCYHKGLSPRILPENADWQAEAARPNPPQTYKAHGKADAPCKKQPLLSVIMPNYNKVPYLKKCLDSILNQSMHDFELLIVDDASTDGSYSLLQDYADKYHFIRLYRMDYNSLQGVCRNIAIRHARGKYITFIDSDDWLGKDFFADGIQLMYEENPDIGIFAVTWMETEKVQQITVPKLLHTGGIGACQALFKGDIPWGIGGKFYNKQWLVEQDIRFPEYIYHQDAIFLLCALKESQSCVTSQKTGYNYLQISGSACHPKHYSYRHIFTEWTYLDLFEKQTHSCGLLHRDKYVWVIENYLLPVLCAFYKATGSIPFTVEAQQCCATPEVLRAILGGFARCIADCPIPQGLISMKPQRHVQTSVRTTADMPLVSVIIPIKNQEVCISRCLDSVLRQSLHSLEVIVVNDASTDATLAICQAYAQKDARVRIYSSVLNSGQEVSRDVALEYAQGKYICYVNGDDYILQDFLLHGACILEKNPHIDLVHFSYSQRTIYGEVERWECEHDALRTGVEVLGLYCKDKNKSWFAWSKIYRHSFLKNNNIKFDKHLFSDNIFLLQVFLYAKHVLFTNKQGYVYIQKSHTSSKNNLPEYDHNYINGIITLAKDITYFFKSHSYLEKNYIFLKLSYLFLLYKKNLTYIITYQNSIISPYTDEDIFHLKASPDFLRLLLEDYSRIYVQHTHYKAQLPLEDTDPLFKKNAPAQELIPYSFNPLTENTIHLSVIVPAYNVFLYLNKCLDSILEQNIDGIEIILVEDCSDNDDTFSVCQEYAQKYSSIRLFRTPWNSGLGTVRNLAVAEARGKYITFLDSDDQFTEYAIPRALAHMNKAKDCDFGIFSYYNFSEEGIKEYFTRPDCILRGKTIFLSFISYEYKQWSSWSTIYKKSFLQKNNILFSKYIYEDEFFLLQSHFYAKNVLYSSLIIYKRYLSENSLMRPKCRGHSYFISTINNIKLLKNFFDKYNLSEIYPQEYKQRINIFLKGHHRDNLLYYIHACKELGLPSPLTDEVLETLTCSDAFLRALLMDHAVLSQKPLPQQKTPVPSHPSPQVTAAPRPQPVKNAPRPEPVRQHLCPHIPEIGMGSFFERALWKVAPKRAAVYALRRSHCFDINYYKAMYPDVAKAGVDPVLHYVYFGAKEGRNPAPWFNTSLYVADNPDVIAAGANPFYHYIRYGHAENRRPAA